MLKTWTWIRDKNLGGQQLCAYVWNSAAILFLFIHKSWWNILGISCLFFQGMFYLRRRKCFTLMFRSFHERVNGKWRIFLFGLEESFHGRIELLSSRLLEGTDENHQKSYYDSWCPEWDSSRELHITRKARVLEAGCTFPLNGYWTNPKQTWLTGLIYPDNLAKNHYHFS